MALLAIGAPEIGEGQNKASVIEGLRGLYPAQAADLSPIPFARTEIEKIAALFPPNKTSLMVGSDADEGSDRRSGRSVPRFEAAFREVSRASRAESRGRR